MILHTLNLGSPLSWTPEAIHAARTARGNTSPEPGHSNGAFLPPVLTREGAEAVFIWTKDQLIADSDDGPRLCRPLPPPIQAGRSEPAGDADAGTGEIVLPAGSYLFCQDRFKDIGSVEQVLEWFFREAWWTRVECRDPVYLRLIHEDGKTAVQVIMAL